MNPSISVVICTHNPRRDYLEQTLAALSDQTLSKDRWELLLIDNASKEDLSKTIDLSWHPNAKHIKEPELGLTPARMRGISESIGDTLIFVDDDNVLQADYLSRSLNIADNFPFLGAWGGQIFPEFDEEPPHWTRAYWHCLAIRSFFEDSWSFSDILYSSIPYGAGLCVRRKVADSYINVCNSDPIRKNLGRKGSSLMSGEDVDLAMHSCDKGMGTGLFRRLIVKHLIPPQRLTPEYLLKIEESLKLSSILLCKIRGFPISYPTSSLRRKILDWLRAKRRDPFAEKFRLAGEAGRKKAMSIDISTRSFKPPVTEVNNLITDKILYVISDSFNYDKMMCSDSGPQYAELMGWNIVKISQIKRDHHGFILVIDHRISESESLKLRDLTYSHPDIRWVFKLVDPCHGYEIYLNFFNLAFSVAENKNVAFMSVYEPTEVTRRLQMVAGDRKFCVIPYSYNEQLEIDGPSKRINKIIISGWLNSVYYPFRSEVFKNSKKFSHKGSFSHLVHPGYPEIGMQLKHTVVKKQFIEYLSTYRHMFLCPSRSFLEFLKYGECGYAGCLPVGLAPNGLPADSKSALVPIDLSNFENSIRKIRSFKDDEVADRVLAYRKGFRQERNKSILNQVFSQFCSYAFE